MSNTVFIWDDIFAFHLKEKERGQKSPICWFNAQMWDWNHRQEIGLPGLWQGPNHFESLPLPPRVWISWKLESGWGLGLRAKHSDKGCEYSRRCLHHHAKYLSLKLIFNVSSVPSSIKLELKKIKLKAYLVVRGRKKVMLAWCDSFLDSCQGSCCLTTIAFAVQCKCQYREKANNDSAFSQESFAHEDPWRSGQSTQ